jgi:hypothetical protein
MPSDIMGRNTTISNMYACSFLAKLTIHPAVQSFQIRRKKPKQRSKQLNNKPLYLREKTVNMSTSNVHNLYKQLVIYNKSKLAHTIKKNNAR